LEGQHVVQQQQQSKGAQIIRIITNATKNGPIKVINGMRTWLRVSINEDVLFIKPLTIPLPLVPK